VKTVPAYDDADMYNTMASPFSTYLSRCLTMVDVCLYTHLYSPKSGST